jgi:hypothetical protein
MRYEVVVGNIGHVYGGNNPVAARASYGEYKRLSESGQGRAAGEDVTLLEGGEPLLEHSGGKEDEHA